AVGLRRGAQDLRDLAPGLGTARRPTRAATPGAVARKRGGRAVPPPAVAGRKHSASRARPVRRTDPGWSALAGRSARRAQTRWTGAATHALGRMVCGHRPARTDAGSAAHRVVGAARPAPAAA